MGHNIQFILDNKEAWADNQDVLRQNFFKSLCSIEGFRWTFGSSPALRFLAAQSDIKADQINAKLNRLLDDGPYTAASALVIEAPAKNPQEEALYKGREQAYQGFLDKLWDQVNFFHKAITESASEVAGAMGNSQEDFLNTLRQEATGLLSSDDPNIQGLICMPLFAHTAIKDKQTDIVSAVKYLGFQNVSLRLETESNTYNGKHNCWLLRAQVPQPIKEAPEGSPGHPITPPQTISVN